MLRTVKIKPMCKILYYAHYNVIAKYTKYNILWKFANFHQETELLSKRIPSDILKADC